MNSFNHYAYGAVADWVFEQAAGIRHSEEAAGFAGLQYAPHPDRRIGWLRAELETRNGIVRTYWQHTEDGVRYELDTPVAAEVTLGGKNVTVQPGKHTFFTMA